jgi:NADH:ubiquinone oxidoreductase subunit F (NADH-binding)
MNKSLKIITKDWNKISPLKIGDYIEVGGYEALKKLIQKKDFKKAILEIKKSGLVGRGGAGFPTGDKIAFVAAQKGLKYFICNLDESEPGTYKDRSIADNNPHLLLEGIIITSLLIGAKKAYIYINGNFKHQQEKLDIALSQARKNGYWGPGILGFGHDLEVELFSGAGAYICGEETALINSIEGNRGEPKLRPPYPTEYGLFGRPTAVNNAETISNIPWIMLNGGNKYSKIGSTCSPGMKLFILGGAVSRPGIVEAPTGTSIRDLIYAYEYGRGLPKGKEFWFAQIGGSSGRLVLEEELDTNLEFSKGCQIPCGSGVITVIDKTTDIHDLILSWTGFFRRESCGKCVPCREGTFRLHEIARRLQDGTIADRDKIALKDILWTLENTTFCPLGKFAATAMRDATEKNLLKFNEKIL